MIYHLIKDDNQFKMLRFNGGSVSGVAFGVESVVSACLRGRATIKISDPFKSPPSCVIPSTTREGFL